MISRKSETRKAGAHESGKPILPVTISCSRYTIRCEMQLLTDCGTMECNISDTSVALQGSRFIAVHSEPAVLQETGKVEG